MCTHVHGCGYQRLQLVTLLGQNGRRLLRLAAGKASTEAHGPWPNSFQTSSPLLALPGSFPRRFERHACRMPSLKVRGGIFQRKTGRPTPWVFGLESGLLATSRTLSCRPNIACQFLRGRLRGKCEVLSLLSVSLVFSVAQG